MTILNQFGIAQLVSTGLNMDRYGKSKEVEAAMHLGIQAISDPCGTPLYEWIYRAIQAEKLYWSAVMGLLSGL